MTIETCCSSTSELYSVVPGSPAMAQESGWSQSHKPEKPCFDDEDFAVVINPPPPRWPRIFPSL